MLTLNCNKTFAALDEINVPDNPVLRISSMLIIGGMAHIQEQAHDLFEDDFNTVIAFATQLAQIGVQIDRPSIRLNNGDLCKGDDFIADRTSADLIISAFVNKDFKPGPDDFEFFESPLLKEGGTWSEAFAQANPKFIGLNTNMMDCVGAEDIPGHYRLIFTNSAGSDHRMLYAREDILPELRL